MSQLFESKVEKINVYFFFIVTIQVLIKGPMKNLLENPKNIIDSFQKFGIYLINCKDCSEKYQGQSRLAITTRYSGDLAHIKWWISKRL